MMTTEMTATVRLPKTGLVPRLLHDLALVAILSFSCFCLGACSGSLPDESEQLMREKYIPKSVEPADLSIITAHESLIFQFPQSMDPAMVAVSGSLGTAVSTWTKTVEENDTLVLNASNSVAWSSGDSRTLEITVSSGGESVIYDYSYDVFDGAYVTGTGTATGSSIGTFLHPFGSIEEGLDLAKSLYLGTAGKSAAAVHVVAGTVSLECIVSNQASNDFILTCYNGGNSTNDGVTKYSPHDFAGPVLLVFLDVNVATGSAGPWFACLKALKDDAAIIGDIQIYIVAFNYSNTTSKYVAVNDGMISGAFPTGIYDSDFIGIPIVKDNGTGSGTDYGKYSREHLSLLGETLSIRPSCFSFLANF